MYLRYTYNLVKVMRLKSMKGKISKISSLTQYLFFHSIKFKEKKNIFIKEIKRGKCLHLFFYVRRQREHLAQFFVVITGEFSCMLQCKIPIDFLFLAQFIDLFCTPSNEPCLYPDVFINFE